MTTEFSSALLRADHREIEAHLDALAKVVHEISPRNLAEIKRRVERLAQFAEPHFRREERIYYPALRDFWPNLLEQLELRHEEIRGVEDQILSSIAGACSLAEERCLHDVKLLCGELIDWIQHHIVEEEDELFRLADEGLPADLQASLLAAMKTAASGL